MEKREALIRTYKLRVKIWQVLFIIQRPVVQSVTEEHSQQKSQQMRFQQQIFNYIKFLQSCKEPAPIKVIKNDRNKSDMPKKCIGELCGKKWQIVEEEKRLVGNTLPPFVNTFSKFLLKILHFDLIFASFWVYYYIVNEKQRHLHPNIILYYIF